MISEDGWRGAIDHPLPSVMAVGRGTALVIAGWLHHVASPVDRMWIRVGDDTTAVAAHSMPRADVADAAAAGDSSDASRAYASGFWAIVPIRPVHDRVGAWVMLGAETKAGASIEHAIDHVTLLPEAVDEPAPTRVDPPLVAICMTTHNPPMDLFERQVESIRAQTHERWRCIISDDQSAVGAFAAIKSIVASDPRFELHQTPVHAGFYFNFQAALERVPADATFVALADQDDVWAPDKVSSLVAALADGAVLAYSDQRIVDAPGRVLSPTFWASRANYSSGLRRMLAGNTVTGAASLFRRELLPWLLPFPPRLRRSFHDHWLAVVALTAGQLAYVDRPLYDYVQHSEQAVGHPEAAIPRAGDSAPTGAQPRRQLMWARWQADYFDRVLPQRLFATVLLERSGPGLSTARRRMLERVGEADTSVGGVLDLIVHAAFERRQQTLGYHRQAVKGILWEAWARRLARGRLPRERHRYSVERGDDLVDYGPESPG